MIFTHAFTVANTFPSSPLFMKKQYMGQFVKKWWKIPISASIVIPQTHICTNMSNTHCWTATFQVTKPRLAGCHSHSLTIHGTILTCFDWLTLFLHCSLTSAAASQQRQKTVLPSLHSCWLSLPICLTQLKGCIYAWPNKTQCKSYTIRCQQPWNKEC